MALNTELEDYRGPDRRYVGPERRGCDCHAKHESMILDHSRQLEQLYKDREDRRKEWEEKMTSSHERIWKGIESKVSSRLFYLFITAYTSLFVMGVVTLYGKFENNVASIQQTLTEVRLAQTEVKVSLNNTEVRISEIRDHLDGRRK